MLLSDVFEKCETEMWMTHSSLSGVIKQICGWTGKAMLPELYHRVVLWYYWDFAWKNPLLPVSAPKLSPGLGWLDTSNDYSLPEEINWVLAFHKL